MPVSSRNLRFFEVGRVFVRFDHVPSRIIHANHGAMRTAGARAIPATKYPCPVASKDRGAGFYHPPNSFEHRLLCKAQNVSLRGRHKNLMPKMLWRVVSPQKSVHVLMGGPPMGKNRPTKSSLFPPPGATKTASLPPLFLPFLAPVPSILFSLPR